MGIPALPLQLCPRTTHQFEGAKHWEPALLIFPLNQGWGMALASPDRSFSDHPEYYSAVSDVTVLDGSAQGGTPKSINYANPEVARVMAENSDDSLNQNPEVSIVTVWMNDAPAARMFGTHPKVLANHVAYGELD